MRGFQLWINLPASEKMKPAHYRDIPAEDIPRQLLPDGGYVNVIAGQLALGALTVQGPINPAEAPMATDPLFLDLSLPAGTRFEHAVQPGHNAFLYVYEGSAQIAGKTVERYQAGVLSDGSRVTIEAGPSPTRVVLLAARPLGEPVVQYGPFVMNTREEIEQALADYREGRLAA